ncbi:ATP-dependent DNA ligase [Propionibacteriaceae bacterium G1746]
MQPMLATHSPTGRVPEGPDWVHEVKWDGIRLLADVVDDRLTLRNRRGIDVTVTYPELHSPAKHTHLPHDVLLDGEVVAVNRHGVANLQALAPRMHQRDPRKVAQLAAAVPARFMVFDILRLDGATLTNLPLEQRRELLESLDLPSIGPGWQVPPQYEDGPLLAQATLDQGLEGIISKRLGSAYQPGVRSSDWVKVPHRTEFVGVIGGWVPETENPRRLGSLWIGHPHDEQTFDTDGLLYPITRAGSGLSHAERDDLLAVLRSIETDHQPFVPPLWGPDARRAHWVEPILCVQVRYLGQPGAFSKGAATTAPDAGQLRQPVLRRLRPDVAALEAPDIVVDELE